MKQNYIIILFIIEIYNSYSIISSNTDYIANEKENKIKNITNKINKILQSDNQIKILITESNSNLNNINNKSDNLIGQLINIKFFDNNNIYLKNIIFYLCLISILAFLIYILENKCAKPIIKNIKHYPNNNNINIELKEDVKLLF